MFRSFAILFFSLVFSSAAVCQTGTLDPAFQNIPFDKWLNDALNNHFHAKVHVARPFLSFHLRLAAPIEIELDGADVQARRGNGRLVFLTQVTDSNGIRYQDHTSVELDKVEDNVKDTVVQISQHAFFLPGAYRLGVVILDTATGEHTGLQTQFRVAAVSDQLEDLWRRLPPVELIHSEQSPDSWYLPSVRGQIEWANARQPPAKLNIILNVAPSPTKRGIRPTPSNGLPALLPLLKILSATDPAPIAEDVELVDIGHRRNVFHQDNVKDDLDWLRLKTSLADATAASIDIHALSDPHHDAQFFISEVRRVLRSSNQHSVLVVLSAPIDFEGGEDLEPISLEALPPARIIYIRYHAAAIRSFGPQMGGRGRGGRMGGGPNPALSSHDVFDQLAGTLKPLHPKVLDVESPEQVTKVLKDIASALQSPW